MHSDRLRGRGRTRSERHSGSHSRPNGAGSIVGLEPLRTPPRPGMGRTAERTSKQDKQVSLSDGKVKLREGRFEHRPLFDFSPTQHQVRVSLHAKGFSNAPVPPTHRSHPSTSVRVIDLDAASRPPGSSTTDVLEAGQDPNPVSNQASEPANRHERSRKDDGQHRYRDAGQPGARLAAASSTLWSADGRVLAQRHKIVAKRGGHFTLMVVGESGLGKVRRCSAGIGPRRGSNELRWSTYRPRSSTLCSRRSSPCQRTTDDGSRSSSTRRPRSVRSLWAVTTLFSR